MSDTTVTQAAFAAEVAGATSAPANIAGTSTGILVGVDAPTAPLTTGSFTASTATPPAPTAPAGKFTEEDIARVREQEKAKLYPQIESLKGDLDALKKERDERLSAEETARREAEDAARAKAESEMDLRELLAQKEAEWQQQLEAERAERKRAFGLLEHERKFQDLQTYRSERVEQERDNIIPELVDLIDGTTPEEIESSINSLKDRSSRILESAQSAMQAARRDMTGARVTAPGTGPMDTNTANQSLSPENIAGMSFNEYVKNRSRLLGNSSSNRGMFG
jgi:hypothetical protein